MPTYSNWDLTANMAYNRVLATTRVIATSSGFSATTTPTETEVGYFLDDAYYEIAARLEDAGYSLTQTDDQVQGVLQALQAILASIAVIQTQPVEDEDSLRGQLERLEGRRDALFELISGDALLHLGATRDRDLSAYVTATGVSVDRKTSVEDDTDLVGARFKRGWGQNPATSPQVAESSAYEPSS